MRTFETEGFFLFPISETAFEQPKPKRDPYFSFFQTMLDISLKRSQNPARKHMLYAYARAS